MASDKEYCCVRLGIYASKAWMLMGIVWSCTLTVKTLASPNNLWSDRLEKESKKEKKKVTQSENLLPRI